MHLPNSQAFLHLILTSVGFLRNLFTDIVERYHDADELDIFRVPCSDREENSYKKALLAMINRAACLVTFAQFTESASSKLMMSAKLLE